MSKHIISKSDVEKAIDEMKGVDFYHGSATISVYDLKQALKLGGSK